MAHHVVGFAGSLRKGSYNKVLLRAAVELAPKSGLDVHVVDLQDVPFYDQDHEAEPPPPVRMLRDAVAAADGVLIATPEYNYGLTAVTKNAVDWVSRPAGSSPIAGKPAAILGASTGLIGTARAQLQLRQSFVFTHTIAMPPPEVLVSQAATKFDADGRLTDEPTRELLDGFLRSFAAWIERIGRAGEWRPG
jgi:chromate reductase